jgi:hypothetical protein
MGHASQQTRTQTMTRRGGVILAAAGRVHIPCQIAIAAC